MGSRKEDYIPESYLGLSQFKKDHSNPCMCVTSIKCTPEQYRPSVIAVVCLLPWSDTLCLRALFIQIFESLYAFESVE